MLIKVLHLDTHCLRKRLSRTNVLRCFILLYNLHKTDTIERESFVQNRETLKKALTFFQFGCIIIYRKGRETK